MISFDFYLGSCSPVRSKYVFCYDVNTFTTGVNEMDQKDARVMPQADRVVINSDLPQDERHQHQGSTASQEYTADVNEMDQKNLTRKFEASSALTGSSLARKELLMNRFLRSSK